MSLSHYLYCTFVSCGYKILLLLIIIIIIIVIIVIIPCCVSEWYCGTRGVWLCFVVVFSTALAVLEQQTTCRQSRTSCVLGWRRLVLLKYSSTSRSYIFGTELLMLKCMCVCIKYASNCLSSVRSRNFRALLQCKTHV